MYQKVHCLPFYLPLLVLMNWSFFPSHKKSLVVMQVENLAHLMHFSQPQFDRQEMKVGRVTDKTAAFHLVIRRCLKQVYLN